VKSRRGLSPKGSNSRCGVPGMALKAPKAYADPRSYEGKR